MDSYGWGEQPITAHDAHHVIMARITVHYLVWVSFKHLSTQLLHILVTVRTCWKESGFFSNLQCKVTSKTNFNLSGNP